MGVFARLFRRSRTTEEGRSAEAEAAQETARVRTETTDGATAAAEAADGSEATAEETEQAADDGVGIPKQQSVEEAADHEAGEGART